MGWLYRLWFCFIYLYIYFIYLYFMYFTFFNGCLNLLVRLVKLKLSLKINKGYKMKSSHLCSNPPDSTFIIWLMDFQAMWTWKQRTCKNYSSMYVRFMIMEREKLQRSNDTFFTLPYHSLLFNENSLPEELCQNKRLVHYHSLQWHFIYKRWLEHYLWSHTVFY